MFKALVSAVRILTIIPILGKDTDNFSKSLIFFPFIGLLLGAIVYGIYNLVWYTNFVQWDIVSLLALFLVTTLTGALHIDGIGDVADAFGGGKTKEQILKILKDSKMGTFGITAIVFDLLAKWILWHIYFERGAIQIIFCSLIISRCFLPLFLIFLPYARKDGFANSFSDNTTFIKMGIVFSFSITALCLGIFFPVYTVIILYLSSLLISIFFGLFCLKKIGGITGDCVGTLNELIEIIILLCGLFLINLTI